MSLICRRNNSKTSQVSRAMMDDSRASFWMALRTCKHSRIWLEPCSCLKKTDRYHWRALRKQQLKVRQLMDTASNGPITLPKSISRLKDQIQPLQFKATSSLSYSSALWDLILLLLWELQSSWSERGILEMWASPLDFLCLQYAWHITKGMW